jgi:hypothetical protein
MSTNRAVAFLNILGFKNLIRKNSAENIANQYSRVVDMTRMFNRDQILKNLACF